MLIKWSKKSVKFRNYFYGHKIVDKVNKWLGANSNPPVNSLRGQYAMFKNNKHNNRYSYDIIQEELASVKDFNNKRKAELKAMYKKLDTWEDQDPESEEDLFETDINTGDKVDYNTGAPDYKWVSGTVSSNLGEIIKVSRETSDDMDVDGKVMRIEEQFVLKDSTDLAPYKSKSQSARANVISIYQKAYFI
jgi:hypothetical protein